MTMLIFWRNIVVLPLLVLSSWLPDIANSEGDVGCLFNHELCEELEECFDDNAFGRCQSSYDSEKDFYRHILGFDTMKLLEKELSRLFTGGYRWEHEYTQCVVQNILYAKRHKVSYDPGLCSRIMQMSLPVVPPELIAELETSEPKELALIKFTPNREKNQDLVFADESFTPPEESNSDDTENEAKKRTFASTDTAFHRKKYPTKVSSGSVATEYGQDDALFRHLLEVAKDTQKILDAYSDTANRFPSNKLPVIKTDLSSDLNHRPVFTEGGMEWLPVHENKIENDLDVQNFVQKKKHNDFDDELAFTKQQRYHINKLQSHKEMGDNSNFFNNDNGDNEEIDVPMIQEMMGKKGDRDDDGDNFKWNVLRKNPFEPDLKDFTEDFTGDRKSGIDLARGESNNFLQDNMFGVNPIDNGMPTFQRPMRYDTKKPGFTYFYHDDDDDNESMKGFDQQVAEEDNNILAQLMKTTRKDQLHVVLQTPLEKQQSTPLDEIQADVFFRSLSAVEDL